MGCALGLKARPGLAHSEALDVRGLEGSLDRGGFYMFLLRKAKEAIDLGWVNIPFRMCKPVRFNRLVCLCVWIRPITCANVCLALGLLETGRSRSRRSSVGGHPHVAPDRGIHKPRQR